MMTRSVASSRARSSGDVMSASRACWASALIPSIRWPAQLEGRRCARRDHLRLGASDIPPPVRDGRVVGDGVARREADCAIADVDLHGSADDMDALIARVHERHLARVVISGYDRSQHLETSVEVGGEQLPDHALLGEDELL